MSRKCVVKRSLRATVAGQTKCNYGQVKCAVIP